MSWYKKYLPVFEKPFSQAPQEIIEEIKSNLHRVQSDNPVATVAIIAYNEEIRLLSCIWSLSESSCKYPIEIIGIDNNSTDATPDVYKAVNLPYFTETNKGPGYARNRGLTEARGKYYLCIDSDTMYPKKYVEKMIEELEKPGVVAVSASYSYVPSKEYPKYWLSVYEFIRDVHLFLLSFKNPVWCVRGAVFGHSVELARKIGGYRVHITRGEDGSMAFDLKQFGRISFKRGCKTRAITCTKSIGSDGPIFKALLKRVGESIKGFKRYFFFTGDSDEKPTTK
ncbi:MAG: glycosyl transferase family A [Bacteroidetes bacterium GWF2_41_61]|nr:MAG: glycosyl transferase family A [Bacteroidetes bacterium GWE2_40_15]OFY29663.1 MAG: glycosyl transferase family A [Bacteroidetes bacterium GWF2_41_61]OFY90079.1 MAG: glycosyl transferase family A [Bacteroidetes bacterium RIFOXYA12_FULL_40_10]HBG24982.1 glycosyl transferase family A [Rikenellaceae bacterium]HBZ26696.1 glycosyl transferase family A [Rikenellaceae bacterium]